MNKCDKCPYKIITLIDDPIIVDDQDQIGGSECNGIVVSRQEPVEQVWGSDVTMDTYVAEQIHSRVYATDHELDTAWKEIQLAEKQELNLDLSWLLDRFVESGL